MKVTEFFLEITADDEIVLKGTNKIRKTNVHESKRTIHTHRAYLSPDVPSVMDSPMVDDMLYVFTIRQKQMFCYSLTSELGQSFTFDMESGDDE